MSRRKPAPVRPGGYVPPSEPFVEVVGEGIGRVVVYEDVARSGMATLRWRPAKENWRRRTLGRAVERDEKGRVTKEFSEWAKACAMKQSFVLRGLLPADVPETEAATSTVLTLGATARLLTDPKTGPYPHPTPYRAELLRALDFACTVWGRDRAWVGIRSDDWTALIRTRIDRLVAGKHRAVRAAEVTVVRLRTIVEWLKSEEKIPGEAATLPAKWYEKMVAYWQGATKETEPTVFQPRHTVAEMRAMLAVAEATDPRVGLLVILGAELRLGQVLRCTRSLLTLDAKPHGELTVRGAGQKMGTVVEFTPAQRAAVDRALGPGGYLHALEQRHQAGTLADYCLFPAGWLLGRKRKTRKADEELKHPELRAQRDARGLTLSPNADPSTPMSRAAALDGFKAIEAAAGVKEMKGRGWYGVRRVNVDAALDPEIVGETISEETLQALGGWSSGEMPRAVYRDKEHKAGRRGARKARAAIRGETTPQEGES